MSATRAANRATTSAPRPARGRRGAPSTRRSWPWPCSRCLAAAALLASCTLVGLTGVDTAAHVYKTSLVAHGQSLVWDDFWYGGSYGVVSYGVVYYLAAPVVGAQAIVVLSAGLLPLFFHLYVRRAWQVTSLLPASALAVVSVLYLTNGQDPFLLAMALTMAGLALLAGDHPLWAAVPVGVAAFTNPVAVVAGAVFVVADALAHPARGAARRCSWRRLCPSPWSGSPCCSPFAATSRTCRSRPCCCAGRPWPPWGSCSPAGRAIPTGAPGRSSSPWPRRSAWRRSPCPTSSATTPHASWSCSACRRCSWSAACGCRGRPRRRCSPPWPR